MELSIDRFINTFSGIFTQQQHDLPWQITQQLSSVLYKLIAQLDSTYESKNGIAIHPSAIVESGVILKPPVIIGENCFIGANAYLRGGVFLGAHTKVGTSCEVKTSIIMNHSAVAHFNFIGDSIIGSYVNFEAGSIIANHYNERTDKQIRVVIESQTIPTYTEKFGALVGDHCKIGANAVLSPGTLLAPGTIVKRLELIEQCPAI